MSPRIVLTGGPAAGKTFVSIHLATEAPHLLVRVPEAATQVYDLLGTRWDRLDASGRRDVQRRIYRLQREQEDRLAAAHPDKVLLLDRGSVDGAAYWPQGPHDYWNDLGTTHADELARYDAVIWLESCAAMGIYDGTASNPCRFEDAAAAIDTGIRLGRLWEPHPQFHRVNAFPGVEQKIARVREVLDTILGLPLMNTSR